MSLYESISQLKVTDLIPSLGLILTLIIFIIQQRRIISVQKYETYQRLELASNEVFRFAANNAGVLHRYLPSEQSGSSGSAADDVIADNYFFQALNLFEMAVRLRHRKFFEEDVFRSWLHWCNELLESWYFRQQWTEYSPNYTDEIRRIFDEPVRTFDAKMPPSQRRDLFLKHVAKVLKI